jgi:quercetin dioxygenase-like cupin family protein
MKSDAVQRDRPLFRSVGRGRTIAIVGDVYRFLATGTETGGAYSSFEAMVPPGGGPPPHVHTREAESFYVLEGEMMFRAGDDVMRATAGTFVHLPPGLAHSFKNESDALARMIITMTPAGLEEMFFEVGTPLAEGTTTALPPTHEEIARLLAAAPRYGVEILIP